MISRRSLLHWSSLATATATATAAAATADRAAQPPQVPPLNVELLDLNAVHGDLPGPLPCRWIIQRTQVLDHRLFQQLGTEPFVAVLAPASALALSEFLRFERRSVLAELPRRPLHGLDFQALSPLARLFAVKASPGNH